MKLDDLKEQLLDKDGYQVQKALSTLFNQKKITLEQYRSCVTYWNKMKKVV